MPDQFVETQTILDKIMAHKVEELAVRQAEWPLLRCREAAAQVASPRDMLAALRGDTVALIAEVKHASPSRGILIEDFQPVVLGQTYAANGAAAISVLTDQHFFLGHLNYLTAVREAVTVPVLRKDFVFDPYQVYEGRAAGADALLLIAAVLADEQLADLHALVNELGMVALVEVHNEAELERVLRINPRLLGINNRDLRSFHVELATTQRLAAQVPDDVVLVAESGIKGRADLKKMAQAGAHAVLVGEALVQADDIGTKVREMSGIAR